MLPKVEFDALAEWYYTEGEWNEFVTIEKENKKEDNIYFGIAILVLSTIGLMIFRNTSFLTALTFAIPFSILIPYLRMRFSYKHLKHDVKKPFVRIYENYIQINQHKIEVSTSKKRIKSLKIITAKNNMQLLEIDVQWITRKGPTNDEFRVLIPHNKISEAERLVNQFYKKV